MAKEVRELLEKSILMTVGAAALTAEKAQSIINELIEKGKVSKDEGKTMFEELMERAKKEGQDVRGKIDQGLQRSVRELGVATKDDINEINKHLREIEKRISVIEKVEATKEPPLAEPPRGDVK